MGRSSSLKSAIHKDVVIIGNGPSGITLSYILSGYAPFYHAESHPVNFLHDRLSSKTGPITDLSLPDVAEGLEGRSANPVSVLFDALQHPNADLGADDPSSLQWRQDSERAVDHVVLGKGLPGGIWQTMDNDVLTLSLGNWMQLPGRSFSDWAAQTGVVVGQRASVQQVASYFLDYVEQNGMCQNFSNFSCVTSVRKLPSIDLAVAATSSAGDSARDEGISLLDDFSAYDVNSEASTQDEGCQDCSAYDFEGSDVSTPQGEFSAASDVTVDATNESSDDNPLDVPTNLSDDAIQTSGSKKSQEWEVCCTRLQRDESGDVRGAEEIRYITSNVVVATGSADIPNTLGVTGESLPFVFHSFRQVEEAVRGATLSTGDSLLVVGAGLSAADAIVTARAAGINVTHVFRRSATDKTLVFNKLPKSLYPEYHDVHQYMRGIKAANDYKALPQHSVSVIHPDRTVYLSGLESSTSVRVSAIAVMIGSRPDLSFLESGLSPERNNCTVPFETDLFTHESLNDQGLYALGPLVGDNFVRFLQGGAVAVATHIAKRLRRKT